MINMIQFLEKNPSLVPLLKEKKASLVGVTENELKAILASFDEEISSEWSSGNGLWY